MILRAYIGLGIICPREIVSGIIHSYSAVGNPVPENGGT